MVTATVRFDGVVSYRDIASSLQEQASNASPRFQYAVDCSLWLNLAVTAQGSQFAIGDVEVVTATVDLDEVVSYRGAVSSLQEQASSAPPVPTIEVDFSLCHSAEDAVVPSAPMEPRYHVPEEEIALGNPPAFVLLHVPLLLYIISGAKVGLFGSWFQQHVRTCSDGCVRWPDGPVTRLVSWLWQYRGVLEPAASFALPLLVSDALAPL